ncbi:MAG: stage II sporulation protein R [Clostridia bacterium]|nr:stage II sporulation protein R [Clostridia bacterium]
MFFKNIIFSNKFKNFTIISLLLFGFILFNALSYVSAVSSNISNNLFRLHVIANSNSDADQNLKYIVRDKVLEYVNSYYKSTTKEELVNNLNLDAIRKIAQETIYDNGYSYNVSVELGNFKFPTKTYGDISLPAGFYDALRIKIGNAEGKNWWCVMFPPLCFVDVSSGIVPDSSKEILQKNLDSEEFELISESSSEVKFKFKIVELLQNISTELASLTK